MKKGFTLVEVIGVIVLLGVIVLIVYPTITSVMNSTQGKISDATTSLITSSADLYLEAKNFTISETTCCVTINDIVEEGILKTPLKDAVTGNDIDLTKAVEVVITKENNIYKKAFTIINTCSNQCIIN